MLPKVKIIFSSAIFIIGLIYSLAFYVDYKEFKSLRIFGQTRKGIIIGKKDDYYIEPKFKMPSKYNSPPKGKYFKFHLTVRYPILSAQEVEKEPDTLIRPTSRVQFDGNLVDLYLEKKDDWNNLQILDTIDIYASRRELYYAKDVEKPPFRINHYYLFALIGLVLSIITYRRL